MLSIFQKKTKEDYEENFNDFHCPSDHILIHWKKDEHIVILKGKRYFYEIDWKTTDELDDKIKNNGWEPVKNEILHAVQCIEARILTDWPLHRVKSIKELLVTAIFLCLSFDKENAHKAITEAEGLMESYRKDIIRYWTLWYSGAMVLFFTILTLAFAIFRDYVNKFLDFMLMTYVLSITFGVIGAFFSICLRIGNVDYSGKTGKDIVKMEAISRILIGGISGLIVTLMVEAGIIFPKLQDRNSAIIFAFILAFIAGSSERLVPSIMAHVEKSYSNGEDHGEHQ